MLTALIHFLLLCVSRGNKYTLSKFMNDTKLSGVVDTHEGWGVRQRDQDRNFMRFNKAKCCIRVSAIPVWYELLRNIHSSGSQPYPGWHQKKCDQQVEGNDPPPLHWSDGNPPGVLYSSLESHYKKHIDLLEWIRRRATKIIRGMEYPYYGKI